MITQEKINIYHQYGASRERFEQEASAKEKKLFGKTTWSLILDLYRSISLVKKPQEYTKRVTQCILLLQEQCDPEAFDLLSAQIPFYNDFREAGIIVRELRDMVTPESDLSATDGQTYFSFAARTSAQSFSIGMCDFEVLDEVYVEFLPTGTYQELSIANGWGDAYLLLAARFDEVYYWIKAGKKEMEASL